MYRVKIFNKIAKEGLAGFDSSVVEYGNDLAEPHAILLRSHKLHEEPLNPELLAIGRAGAGVNNIPVEKCTEKGIVVFNTPGANANAVKELVLAGMFLASRNIVKGINYAESLKGQGAEISAIVEKNKALFQGFELRGKKLGVIGLGAIGMMVANDAIKLGMKVEGYDPFISVRNAWGLSSEVKYAEDLKKMLANVDFITIHMPLSDKTKGFINKEKLNQVKKGAILLNFSREEIVNEEDILDAIHNGKIAQYVNDFPSEKTLGNPNIISIPHLGASSEEAETNCAVMVVDQLQDYLQNGNIINSVNFPNCTLERSSQYRLSIINKNIPNMVGQITTILAEHNVNISEMVNKSKGDWACTLVDINDNITEESLQKIKNIPGIVLARKIEFEASQV
jgi:D-3-phosphoglycerate dehydrogenase